MSTPFYSEYLQNLQSMGFFRFASSAIELFGDDIHACCEWILDKICMERCQNVLNVEI